MDRPSKSPSAKQVPGTVVAGRYRIDRLIERGGMGEVYVASHIELGKKVAVKILLPKYAESQEQITRFLQEARGIADIRHRNIVNVMDVGTTKEGLPFFVMELLEGESLKRRLEVREKLDFPDIAWIMVQVLSGLATLHRKRIIHRDMKPSNVFLSRDEDGTEVVKILDFGVSKFHILEQEGVKDLTSTGTILGTPSYMSPEQARGFLKELDQRTDTYACGMILYRTLAGLNPFRGNNYNEVIGNILSLDLPPPSFFTPGIPPKVDALVLKAVRRDKEERFQDCQAFTEALTLIMSEEGLTEKHASTEILYRRKAADVENPATGPETAEAGGVTDVPDVAAIETPTSIVERCKELVNTFIGSGGRGRSLRMTMIVLAAIVLLAAVGAGVYWGFANGGKGADGKIRAAEGKIPSPVPEALPADAATEALDDVVTGIAAFEDAGTPEIHEDRLDESEISDYKIDIKKAPTESKKKKTKLIEEFPKKGDQKALITEFPGK
jgi:tRNA A-37 threonylcarbamoyl transferase component Bud32